MTRNSDPHIELNETEVELIAALADHSSPESAVLDREERYLLEHFDADCGIMPGDVEGSFHRIREAFSIRAQQMPERDDLIDILREILEVEQEFRDAMPADWDGDPLHDAWERGRLFINSRPVPSLTSRGAPAQCVQEEDDLEREAVAGVILTARRLLAAVQATHDHTQWFEAISDLNTAVSAFTSPGCKS